MGVECWDEEVRNVIVNRSESNEDIKNACEIFEKIGQPYALDYILGLPRAPVKLEDGSTRPMNPEETLDSYKNELMSCTYYPNSPALSTANPEMWNSNDELISALEGNLKHSPENWWWARYIPKFMYPYIVWRLKKNPQEMKCQLKTLSESIRLCKIKKIDLLKIDCEGNELKVINGIQNEDWDIIKQLIIEVHDIGNRLDYIQNLLKDKNYNVQIVKEPSLENTALYNLYAQR